MVESLLKNWLFLACVSSVATAALIVLSSQVLGGIHSSVVMFVRIIGVALLVTPIFLYAYSREQIGGQILFTDIAYTVKFILVGVFAGISWYTFYLALEYGNKASASDATITAINYSSVALILLINWLLGRQDADWRNLLGVLLVIAGVYLTSLSPPSAALGEQEQNARTNSSE